MSIDSSGRWESITPSDDSADDYPAHGRPRAVFIGGDGDLVAVDIHGNSETFAGLVAGVTLNIRPVRIATATSATNLLALF